MAKKKSAKKISKETEFAVIENGGKQYTVRVGDVITLEKIPGTNKEGDKIVFDKVVLVDNGKDTTIGTPYIVGASVEASFMMDGREKTVTILRYKQKSRYRKMRGHRQPFSKVKITAIK